MVDEVKALIFDVFGTVVDWRSSIARIAGDFAAKNGVPPANWDQFARDWRDLYQPSMQRVRSGELPFTKLDTLHRMNIEAIAGQYGFGDLSSNKLDELNLAWHQLTPWPDSVEGLTLLKSKFIIGTHSNGNIALMVYGLVLSVILTGAGATYLANYIQKHIWIAYIGLGFILLVAIQLIIGGLVDLEILQINEQFKKYF